MVVSERYFFQPTIRQSTRLFNNGATAPRQQGGTAMKRKMYTIKEAAQLIDGINEYRIRTMCKTGQLRAFKAGNKFLISESDLYTAVFGKDFSDNENGGAA